MNEEDVAFLDIARNARDSRAVILAEVMCKYQLVKDTPEAENAKRCIEKALEAYKQAREDLMKELGEFTKTKQEVAP